MGNLNLSLLVKLYLLQLSIEKFFNLSTAFTLYYFLGSCEIKRDDF